MVRRINLLPPELRAKRRARQTLASIAAAGAGLVVLLAAAFVWQNMRLSDARSELEAQQEASADLRRRAAALQQFARAERELENRLDLLGELTAVEVRWSALLADVSLVIPSNVWLSSLTASVQAPQAPPPGQAAETPTYGQIQMTGFTFQHIDVARWLTRLAGVDALAFPYISLSQRTELFDVEVVTFSSTVDLTEGALRRNQRGAGRRT